MDIDLTGLPCSAHYEGASKGYFAGAKRGTTGRQLVRVSASQYDEIVYQKVYPGNTGSADLDLIKTALLATLEILDLSSDQTAQLLLRLDGGFGTTAIIEYILEQGYQFVLKLHSGTRSKKWDEAVAEADWCQDDTNNENGRRWGSCLSVANPYANPLQHKVWLIGVRCQKSDKTKTKDNKAKTSSESETRTTSEYAYSVLAVRTEQLAGKEKLSKEEVLEQLDFYDKRATIESASFRGDKQGLKLAKRRKYSLYGQEMLVLLTQLAHNLIAWAKSWLSEAEPRLGEYGIKVWVRDLFTMKGQVTFVDGQIVKVRLRRGHQYARRFFETLATFFAKSGIRLILSET